MGVDDGSNFPVVIRSIKPSVLMFDGLLTSQFFINGGLYDSLSLMIL